MDDDDDLGSNLDEHDVATSNQQLANGDSEELDTATSLFPAIPSLFKRFTSTNLGHARTLSAHAAGQDLNQDLVNLAKSAQEGLDFDLLDLVNPPRLDWIREDGSWQVFGETWPLNEQTPTLTDAGLTQLYTTGEDRRESLQKLLQTVLVTYSQLIAILLRHPPSRKAVEEGHPSELSLLIEHIKLASINMHHLLNELRPIQARESLLGLRKREIAATKEKTTALKLKCEETKQILEVLRKRQLSVTPAVDPNTNRAQQTVVGDLDIQKIIDITDLI